MESKFRFSTAGVFLVLGSTAVSVHAAGTSCDVTSLTGSYQFQASGQFTPRIETAPGRSEVYKFESSTATVSGTLDADGQGHVRIQRTFTAVGYPTGSEEVTGTYDVNRGCKGTIQIAEGDGYKFEVLDSGNVRILGTSLPVLGTAWPAN